jgi:hypothetical protein
VRPCHSAVNLIGNAPLFELDRVRRHPEVAKPEFQDSSDNTKDPLRGARKLSGAGGDRCRSDHRRPGSRYRFRGSRNSVAAARYSSSR